MFLLISSNIQASINSLGIILDIIGAWEVVNQFNGIEIEIASDTWEETKVEKTKDHKNWENKKYKLMKLGMGLLTLGFLFQLLSNWI